MLGWWLSTAALLALASSLTLLGGFWSSVREVVFCQMPLAGPWCEKERSRESLRPDARFVKRQLKVNPNAKKVLVYSPSFGHHHAKFMNGLADLLAVNGYNVTVLIPEMDASIRLEPSAAGAIRLPTHPETKGILTRGADYGIRQLWQETSPLQAISQLFDQRAQNFSTMFDYECELTLAHRELLSSLRADNYDLAISEVFDLCGVGLFHLLGIPRVVLASSMHLHEFYSELLGLPPLAGSVISGFVTRAPLDFSEEWTWRHRLANYGASYGITKMMFGALLPKEERLFKQIDPDFPGFAEVLRRSAALFSNTHPLLGFNDPTLPNILHVGGIDIQQAKPLSVEWHEYMMKRPRTVLVSFGTVFKACTMPEEYLTGLLSAFSRLPNVTFLLKHESPSLLAHRLPLNVHAFEWLPQKDLLADKRLSLFITHGGIGSTIEAAYSGVPLLFIPVHFDQARNGLMMTRHGAARVLRKADALSRPAAFAEVIREMLTNASYTEHAHSLAEQLRLFGDQKHVFLDRMRFISSLPREHRWRSFDGLSTRVSPWALANLDLLLAGLVLALLLTSFIAVLFNLLFRITMTIKLKRAALSSAK